MSRQAFVTLVTTDEYAIGALTLAESLKKCGSSKERVVLITNDVSLFSRQLLTDAFDHVYLTSEICSYDDLALSLMGRPELGATFTKLHCWRLTQYTKCVFLDADTLVLQNCDELFEREELSAVADTGWPDCFNSGVFVFQPSLETFAKLVSLATTQGSFDGGDQGLLNTYFSSWRSDLTKRLPFAYNMVSNVSYTYAPAYRHFGSGVKIVHFLGSEKPWMVRWRTDTNEVVGESVQQHTRDLNVPVLNNWIEIFRATVLPKLPENAQLLVRYSTSATVRQLLQTIYSKEIKEDETRSIWNQGDSLIQNYFPSHYNAKAYQPTLPFPSPVHLSHYEAVHMTEPFYSEPSSSTHQHDHPSGRGNTPPPPLHESYPSPQVFLPAPPSESEPPHTETVWESSPPEGVQETVEEDGQSTRSSRLRISIVEEPSDPHWEALLWHTIQNPWIPPSPPPSIYELPPSQQYQPSPTNVRPTFGWFSEDSGKNREWASIQYETPSEHDHKDSDAATTSERDFRDSFGGSNQFLQVTSDTGQPSIKTEMESIHSSQWNQPPSTLESRSEQPSEHAESTHRHSSSVHTRNNMEASEKSISKQEHRESYSPWDQGTSRVEQSDIADTVVESVVGTDYSEEKSRDDIDEEANSICRMRLWEEGNIDYLGKDSFDNILSKLQMMLRSPEPSLSESSVSDELLPEEASLEDNEESSSSFIESDDNDGGTLVPEESLSDESEDLWLGYPEGDYSGMLNWQEGNIDYCGRDKSDNIMRRLDAVIAGVPSRPTSRPM